MKCKYKKFLKAAYIDYEEDYCSNAVLRDNRPPLSEILAPATFELTLSAGEGYYWTTFYTSMANYLAPEGVIVYKEHLDGNAITSSAVDDRIINKRQGVVLRSSTSSITLTKIYSRSSDSYSDNSLIGTDYDITNPGYAYVLGNKSPRGIGFYKLSSTGKIKANKAYLIIPVTYLTQWKVVGNSEVHGNEIWSCGEYNSTDGKYHILVKPQGGSIADIALTEPLRKVNDVADKIEFSNGAATVTRVIKYRQFTPTFIQFDSQQKNVMCLQIVDGKNVGYGNNPSLILDNLLEVMSFSEGRNKATGTAISQGGTNIFIRNADIEQTQSAYTSYFAELGSIELIYELATPTTELVDAPQIQEADSYACVISQDAKAVLWSSFETE